MSPDPINLGCPDNGQKADQVGPKIIEEDQGHQGGHAIEKVVFSIGHNLRGAGHR
jgi:hypothetical protein